MKLWVHTTEFSEGKFLVVRRDGTTPQWPHFVMGARDPAAPFGLHGYAVAAARLGFDPDYCESVKDLADDFDTYRQVEGNGDPDAPPHRRDAPLVLAMMRHRISVADVIKALEEINAHAAMGGTSGIRNIASALLIGRKPPYRTR